MYSAKYFGGCFMNNEPMPQDLLPEINDEGDENQIPIFQ